MEGFLLLKTGNIIFVKTTIMRYKNILLENSEKISHIMINRPNFLNSLDSATILELNQAILSSEESDEIRCIIISGSGEKSFVAGADIKEFSDFKESEGEALSRDGQKLLFDLLENCSTPSIAAVNGFALGGGLELAMACHIRIASKNAKLGLPETSLGVIPGYGGTQRLPNLVGKGKAIEMIATAQMISAEEALKWGLVNQVVEQENLLEHCRKIAFQIIKNSPMAIDKAIKSINAGFIDQKQGFEMEKKNFGECFGTSEFKEGVSAFLEKRKANF